MTRKINTFAWIITALGVALCLLLVACGQERSGPRDSFEQFLSDIWRGRYDEALNALTPESRALLMPSIESLQAYNYTHPVSSSELLVVTRVDSPFDLRRIEVTTRASNAPPQIGDEVELKLHYYDERTARAVMVWGGENWLVHLPALTTSSALDTKTFHQEDDVENRDEQPREEPISNPEALSSEEDE